MSGPCLGTVNAQRIPDESDYDYVRRMEAVCLSVNREMEFRVAHANAFLVTGDSPIKLCPWRVSTELDSDGRIVSVSLVSHAD